MATVNATLSNFFGIAELSYRGIGSGETRSHPSLPTFMQDVGKIQGVNYASSFSEAVMGKGSLTNAVNSYSEEKTSFKSEFKNAMDNAKKTAGNLNNLDYGAKKDSPLITLNQNNINGNSNKNNPNSKVLADRISDLHADDDDENLRAQRSEDAEDDSANQTFTELANESRTTPPFQAKIEDDTKTEADAMSQNPPVSETKAELPTASDAISVDPAETAGQVSNLMNDYNNTVGFLQSRMGTSGTFDHFASSFGNASKMADDMDKIGVQFEPATGMVSVDTKALTDAIKDSPDSVESILGKNGFGGEIEKSSEAGKFGSDKMFPSITESFGGGNDQLKGMYGHMRQVTSTPRGNLGNFMDTNY